ncbi:DUF4288 domain-containing protein [Paraglaciecola aquimarina]|uniref:DUF4288 domain-containing protein n=1 Tax=Paraglaciecola aquimarina TaxID=1235557 RepID=A0ABU3SZ41_9ALTE|nr:DUF4288 domain-containing protein [Paraglaciecola aquimarina]MDU0355284.1 DUF4288 domain-containing protein [Paraglaciecola aquimarina]
MENNSPIGWYIASYVIRFIEIEDGASNNPDKKFLVWENSILVKASNKSEAYDKTVNFACENCEPYEGGKLATPVKWRFEGVTSLLAIYEEFEDGSEIMYREYNQKLKKIRKGILTRTEAIGENDA